MPPRPNLAVRPLHERRVLVLVTGGIAAMKAPLVVRELTRQGASVRVAMTASAKRFVGMATFKGILRDAPLDDLWGDSTGEPHVALSEWAEIMVVVPATAHTLARMTSGHADELVSATLLSAACPVIVAPGMHFRMWNHPATQSNVLALRSRGVTFTGPVNGELASGDIGDGRMVEPAEIVDSIRTTLMSAGRTTSKSMSDADLRGLRIVITAGPTLEDIDPVRFLGNRSTGKMGYALASRARERGATVTLISGPVSLSAPDFVDVVQVRSAQEMEAAVQRAQLKADVVIMAAAVGDYRVEKAAPQKLKRKKGPAVLSLVANPDILAGLGAKRSASKRKRRPVLVGFCVETENLVKEARRKLRDKAVDLIVANLAKDSFGRDDNEVVLVTDKRAERLPKASKDDLANAVLDRVALLAVASLE